jgi:hypothetical protein
MDAGRANLFDMRDTVSSVIQKPQRGENLSAFCSESTSTLEQ